MQRLIAYRVDKQERVLNLSGTGTGKTLSAILASRVIGAQLTVISCPNAIVNSWRETILNAYPESEVLTKEWPDLWPSTGKPRYLILNHEMFQDRNEHRIKGFIEQNPYELVVIDELHQVKRRDPDSESQRRRLLTGVITDIPSGRAKPRVLGMSATPIINNLEEGRSLIELITSLKHDDIETKSNVANCMKMYQHFSRLGFRMLPKYNVGRLPRVHRVDSTPFLGALTDLGPKPHPQKVEAVLLRAKWPVIRDSISGKTVIFTEYVADIVPYLYQKVQELGFSVCVYTGEAKLATEAGYANSLQQFLKGETQVLIASIRTLATGVDGLQYVCNNVIFATLPWTSSDYDQAVGRFDREGFVFDSLKITIPETFASLSSGEEWSWCKSRIRRIENKRDIAKAAVDGEIPDEQSRLTPQKATEYWMGWLKRLNNEGLYDIDRREIKVPLDGSNRDVNSQRRANYGDFSTLNARWNNANSKTTHERLQLNPEEWCYYHTMLLDHEQTWQVVPREKCLEYLKKNLPPNSVIGDFGCGRNTLAEELSQWHLVHSFDHVALGPKVTQCDFANTPIDDSTLDAAVFSLSLMGNNTEDYIEEAYRTLKLAGQLLVWDTRDDEANSTLRDMVASRGFAILSAEAVNKWYSILAIKQSR
jgi:superfamily II DNA or RNA helicase